MHDIPKHTIIIKNTIFLFSEFSMPSRGRGRILIYIFDNDRFGFFIILPCINNRLDWLLTNPHSFRQLQHTYWLILSRVTGYRLANPNVFSDHIVYIGKCRERYRWILCCELFLYALNYHMYKYFILWIVNSNAYITWNGNLGNGVNNLDRKA